LIGIGEWEVVAGEEGYEKVAKLLPELRISAPGSNALPVYVRSEHPRARAGRPCAAAAAHEKITSAAVKIEPDRRELAH
jgi:hypothetical protein